MSKVTIGIDNGTTGTIAIIGPDGSLFDEIPTKPFLSGRAGKTITRVDHAKLGEFIELNACASATVTRSNVRAYVERPFTGKFLNAVLPGQRAFEAVLIVLEQLNIGFDVVDSRDWQPHVLGKVSGSADLKRASLLRGAQIYPQHTEAIKSHGDADGLLIAHHFHHR